MAETTSRRRIPRGSALDWSEDDLDRFSEITQDDIEAARIAWRRDAPPAYRELFDAEPEPED